MKKFLVSALFALSLFQSTVAAQAYTVSVGLTDPHNQTSDYNRTVNEVADPVEFCNQILGRYYGAIQNLSPGS